MVPIHSLLVTLIYWRTCIEYIVTAEKKKMIVYMCYNLINALFLLKYWFCFSVFIRAQSLVGITGGAELYRVNTAWCLHCFHNVTFKETPGN